MEDTGSKSHASKNLQKLQSCFSSFELLCSIKNISWNLNFKKVKLFSGSSYNIWYYFPVLFKNLIKATRLSSATLYLH